MKRILLDMVWPALYVSETLYKFWFLIIGTIVIETFVIKYFLKYQWKKSIIASIIGNCVSGFIGTFLMIWAMLFWHLVADKLVPHATFDPINWVATFILMCLGSVFLETFAIKLLYKEKIKQIFLPMLTGNFLSYAFIAYVLLTATNTDPDEKKKETLKFLPNKTKFILLDGSKMQIDTSVLTVSINNNGKRLNDIKSTGYDLYIQFQKQNKNSFQFHFITSEQEYSEGINEKSQLTHFKHLKNEYKVFLEQKNPDTSLGWKSPMVTDTLIFKKLKN